jgi:hypothetical protein
LSELQAQAGKGEGGVNEQPPLFVVESHGDIASFCRRLITELDAMKIVTDTPLNGWWTEYNRTLTLVIQTVKRLEREA